MIFLQQQNVTFPPACFWYLLENLRKTAVLGFRLRAWHSVLMCTTPGFISHVASMVAHSRNQCPDPSALGACISTCPKISHNTPGRVANANAS